ncbi:heavy metal-binding protein HIP-like [Mercenaria mercenaria]|uniref:heavy metal-binding protein HIP-like n=1 Tax=Mercenaria mercenaria TaxID=6596 RepID=UPI00234EA781|nr:heavy metal-binding protein HIP-like [Mercenaria mercenaria]
MNGIVIVSLFLGNVIFASEPECSRFHYEEKTLEKMIKLEILVQKMKSDVETTEKLVFDTLQDLTKEREQIKHDWENEKEAMKNELKEMKEDNREQMVQYAKEVENIKESASSTAFAFAAELSQSNVQFISGQTFIYKRTILNEGNGYDKTSGIFTAPVKGTYLFTVQFCTPRSDGVGYAIMSDNEEIKRGYIYDSDASSCHSSDAFAVLSKGGRVWIKCTANVVPLHGGNYWNTFSGALIHK